MFHLLIAIALLGFYYGMLIYLDPSFWFYIIFLMLFIVLLVSLLVSMKKIKRSLNGKIIKMTTNQEVIPYPQKFKDDMVELGGFFKGYRYRKHMIPDYLVEFREGRTLYLYPHVTEISESPLTIIRVHRFELALVKDEQDKKRIVHLKNVQLVS
jgi:hypothetical protein